MTIEKMSNNSIFSANNSVNLLKMSLAFIQF